MATYQDIHRVIKETIQVDADPTKRWSPQRVRLINKDNEFYGHFSGDADITKVSVDNIFARSGFLNNVDLSNCTLYDNEGHKIELSSISDNISQLFYRVSLMSTEVYISLPNTDKLLQLQVDELSSNKLSIDDKFEDVYQKITLEEQQRLISDNELQKKILSVETKISSSWEQFEKKLDEHIEDNHTEFYNTKKELREYTQCERHYDINEVADGQTYNVLKDFASNKVERTIPDAYINHGETNIGCLYGIKRDVDGTVTEFTFKVFDDYKSEILGSSSYKFPRYGVEEVLKYKYKVNRGYYLVWNNPGVAGEKIQLKLEGAESDYYYQMSCMNGDDAINVAKIRDYVKKTDGTLISGNVKFENPIEYSKLWPFEGETFYFDEETDSKFFEDMSVSAKYDRDAKKLYMLTNLSSIRKYHSLVDGSEFGRIYEGWVSYKGSDVQIDSISVLISDKTNVNVLNSQNGYSDRIGDTLNYVTLSNECILINHKEDFYGYQMYKYDIHTSEISEIKAGQLRILEVNVQDLDDVGKYPNTIGLSIDYPEGDESSYLNGYYVLENKETGPKNFMKTMTILDKSGKQVFLVLTYNLNYKNLVSLVIHGETVSYQSIYVNLNEKFIYDGSKSYISKASSPIREYSGYVEFPMIDGKDVDSYFASQSEERHEEIPSTIGFTTLDSDRILKFKIPNKEYDNKLREFLVYLKIDNEVEISSYLLELYGDGGTYEYNYNGTYVGNSVRLYKDDLLLRFSEYQRNSFQIEEVRNKDQIELLVRELSVTNTATIANLYVQKENVVDSIVDNLSVDSRKLTFSDVSKTANEICSDIQSQILSNDQDILDISGYVANLSGLYHNTFSDTENLPNKLLIRDEAEPATIYQLTIAHGMLAVKKYQV